MKGYKAFNTDWTCKGKQYKVGETFEETGELCICSHGIHFCENISDIFDFYPFDGTKTKVAEVDAIGSIIKNDKKCCTDKITIIREIPWDEVLKLCNTGDRNTGYRNTGDRNTGDRNTGDRNTGYRNTGNRNTGNCNAGGWNTGYRNTGDRNTGDCNTGNWNTGDWNTGDCNTGDCNTGDWNTGNRNTGDWNTGDCNTGDCNTGDWNTGNRNTGCFCTDKNPKMILFDKASAWTYMDWIRSEARKILFRMPNYTTLVWTFSNEMTEAEKKEHPEHTTLGGFLKEVTTTKEDRQAWWNSLSDDDKNEVLSIPNFDADKFEECTGIHTELVKTPEMTGDNEN